MAKHVTCLIFLSLLNIIWACKDATLISAPTLSCKEKKEIVDWHNYYRNRVGNNVPTENMRKLYWDEQLAAKAQTLASSCVFEHDSKDARKIKGFKDVGQIIWQTTTKGRESSSGSAMKFKEQIDAWYQEGLKYTGTPTPEVERFTQLVWDNTYKVGCGFSYFKKKDYYIKYYVCNYAPGGNLKGKFPYTYGTGCERSDIYEDKEQKGLCNTEYQHDLICP